jgi:lipopolysaccharide transport system ATP-binding protein
MTTVISVENLSKTYRLGQIGTGTFSRDLELWWAKLRGKPNPMLRIGEKDHGNRDGEELWALRDVSFTVEQGEVLGIIGRNGAGKSTLLKILSRVTAPTSGRIKVKGRIASLLEVGTGFHPELTGRENIYLNGAILGMTKQEVTRKFEEIVDFAEVEKFIDTPVKRYSSGMYVRLAFAVAAHLDPEILIVDEVLAVGDVEFQKKCLGKMGDVAKEGRTVLFVSHNMSSVLQLCAKAMLLRNGQVFQIGSAQEIIEDYLNENHLLAFHERELVALERVDPKYQPLLQQIRLFKGQQPTSRFDALEELTIEVVCLLTPDVFHKVSLGIVVTDNMGSRQFVSHSNQYLDYPVKGSRKGIFCATIDQLGLVPGNYNIALHLSDGARDVDVVQNAISFDVLWSPRIPMKYPPRSNWGKALVFVHWSIKEV